MQAPKSRDRKLIYSIDFRRVPPKAAAWQWVPAVCGQKNETPSASSGYQFAAESCRAHIKGLQMHIARPSMPMHEVPGVHLSSMLGSELVPKFAKQTGRPHQQGYATDLSSAWEAVSQAASQAASQLQMTATSPA